MRPTLLAAALLLAGCASNPAPVPVAGTSADLDRLAGEWTGTYSSAQTGRSGSITFRLRSGTDSAWGDVVMIPEGRTEAIQPMSGPEGRYAGPGPQLLSIRFVQISGGLVTGVLDPYRDPVCGCAVYTTFTGRLRDGRIDGDFVSRHSEHAGTRAGTWWVARR